VNAVVIGAENSHQAQNPLPAESAKAFKAPSYPLIEDEANAAIAPKNAGFVSEFVGWTTAFAWLAKAL
jgi:hypothetical protein